MRSGRLPSSIVGLTTLLAVVACGREPAAPTAWRDPSFHRVQLISVDDDVKLEVLDWGGTGRAVVLLAGSGNTAQQEQPDEELRLRLPRSGAAQWLRRRNGRKNWEVQDSPYETKDVGERTAIEAVNRATAAYVHTSRGAGRVAPITALRIE